MERRLKIEPPYNKRLERTRHSVAFIRSSVGEPLKCNVRQRMTKEQLDPLVQEIRTFLDSYSEHDPDCPAFNATGPAVRDSTNCMCGLTVRQQELISKLEQRLRAAEDRT